MQLIRLYHNKCNNANLPTIRKATKFRVCLSLAFIFISGIIRWKHSGNTKFRKIYKSNILFLTKWVWLYRSANTIIFYHKVIKHGYKWAIDFFIILKKRPNAYQGMMVKEENTTQEIWMIKNQWQLYNLLTNKKVIVNCS